MVRSYKSIAACDIPLGPLTYLVGPNGSGKSNFLDALRFVADSLRSSLEHAIRDRGGIDEVRRRSSGHPNHFGLRLELNVGQTFGHYAFEIEARVGGGYGVKSEECSLRDPETGRCHEFLVSSGSVVRSSASTLPAPADGRLFLVNASGVAEFRPLYDALSRMGFYNLNPAAIRELQTPDAGDLLRRDGGNLASVVKLLETRTPSVKDRIESYLSRVAEGVTGVMHKTLGPKETLEFRQEVVGARSPWRFLAANMSDGTLRALGVLVALLQDGANGTGIPLVGIEEPEMALHPAAFGVLLDCLREASARRQVLVTSHSPDLLDDERIPDEALLAVVADRGQTTIGLLDAAGRSALHDHLYTAGDLLRGDQLRPHPDAFRLRPENLDLFGSPQAA